MGQAWIDFEAPDLAAQVEKLSDAERDNLSFGVVHLDREGTVLFYSAVEARLSGYGMTPLGKNFFVVGRNPAIPLLRERIMTAIENGPVDLEFAWTGDLAHPKGDLRIRVQSAHDGGVWLCIERDHTSGMPPCAKQ